MEEERERDGKEQQKPLEQKGNEQMVQKLVAQAPTVPSRLLVFLGWGLFVVSFIIALFLAVQLANERRRNADFEKRISQLEDAVFSARKVFLERSAAELGYAGVDLQSDPPKRYQVTFRLDEASRWLRDAEPLLSENGRIQAQNLQRDLRQLPILIEQDPVNARKELARIQDSLEKLISSETRSQ